MGQAVATYVPANGPRCFQLFGFDVMLDAALRAWVLEVNLDPSLATDAPLDLAVKSAVITDLLNLVGVGDSAAESDQRPVAPSGLSDGEAERSAKPAEETGELRASILEEARGYTEQQVGQVRAELEALHDHASALSALSEQSFQVAATEALARQQ